MIGADGRIHHVAITGAAGGIGSALTHQFAEAGAQVSAIGRNTQKLSELAEAYKTISPLNADIADADQCAHAFAKGAERFGPVSVLLATAAVYPIQHLLDQSASHLEHVLRVNVVGVANSVRAVLPTMLDMNFGRIVIFGSLADLNPGPGSIAYCASKGALHALSKGIAREIDRDRYPNVLINEFSPGATRTAMADYGNDPYDIYEMLLPLIECDATGPHGRFFQERREIRVGESWKGAIKRVLLRRS